MEVSASRTNVPSISGSAVRAKPLTAAVNDGIYSAANAKEFKLAAKKLLLNNCPIDKLVEKAGEFRRRTGDNDIMNFMIKVRDALRDCPGNKRQILINRMFRRNNPLFILPLE